MAVTLGRQKTTKYKYYFPHRA